MIDIMKFAAIEAVALPIFGLVCYATGIMVEKKARRKEPDLIDSREAEHGRAVCGHNHYWTTFSGSCVWCRIVNTDKQLAAKSAKVKELEERGALLLRSIHRERCYALAAEARIVLAKKALEAHDTDDWAIASGEFRNAIELALEHLFYDGPSPALMDAHHDHALTCALLDRTLDGYGKALEREAKWLGLRR